MADGIAAHRVGVASTLTAVTGGRRTAQLHHRRTPDMWPVVIYTSIIHHIEAVLQLQKGRFQDSSMGGQSSRC